MKKLIHNALVLSVLLSTSCGKSEICDCADKGLAMVKEVKAAGMNVEKLQEIQNRYKSDLDECEKLDDGKTDKEQKLMMEEMKQCDAYKEMESTMKGL